MGVDQAALQSVLDEGESKLDQESSMSSPQRMMFFMSYMEIKSTIHQKNFIRQQRFGEQMILAGFGFLNFVFEGLVSGDKYGSAVGIAALILVVGGAFGIIMKTGAIDAGIFSLYQ